jgi:ParB-like chromosome segregation protein Spo0J
MTNQVKQAFSPEVIKLQVDQILPLRKIEPSVKKTKKYRQIAASIAEVGVIEHMVVHAQPNMPDKFMLLDGHLRLEVLKDMGTKEVCCLVSKDDEAFTYNHKVNRLSPIQEHFMILKAIEKGVADDRIAKALNVDLGKIRQKRNLLKYIDPEVVELLKDKQISPGAIRILRKMDSLRQIEVAELMIAAHNFTVPYAKALLAATPQDQLLEKEKERKIAGLTPDERAKMEIESSALARDIKIVKDNYGKDTLNLVLACGFISRILENGRVVRYLSKGYPDMLSEFQKIIDATSLARQAG